MKARDAWFCGLARFTADPDRAVGLWCLVALVVALLLLATEGGAA